MLITTKNLSQVQTLLSVRVFSNRNIPVTAKAVWGRQFSFGKIYAPELSELSLEEILELMKHAGVVSVRKLFWDPNRASVPMYVLTFLDTNRPEKIRIGYSD